MGYGDTDKTTCTACAGTNILEFAALSRLTGDGVYEERARRSMEAIWRARHRGHDLVGTTIDIHNGEWTRKGEREGEANAFGAFISYRCMHTRLQRVSFTLK